MRSGASGATSATNVPCAARRCARQDVERGARRESSRAVDRDDPQVDVEPAGEPAGAVDQRDVAFARRDAQHDPRERPLAAPIRTRAQHLAYRQLAQRRQVLGAEEVAQRGVDAIGRIDLPFAQALPQHVGRDVDEDDLVGELQHAVGQRLAHARPGHPIDRVARRLRSAGR